MSVLTQDGEGSEGGARVSASQFFSRVESCAGHVEDAEEYLQGGEGRVLEWMDDLLDEGKGVGVLR